MDSSIFLTSVVSAIGLFTLFGTIFLVIYRKSSIHLDKNITAFSLSPSSSLSRNWKHHVFPSFHGAAVRKAFLSHILKELKSKGIDPFIDNDVERSKAISPALIEAIRGSRIAIVLLSRNYASSTWCLNELVEIMKCMDKLGQIVMTIFYEVDPSDVKKQTGDFGKVFKKTCNGKTKEDIRKWRKALAKVATIAGYHSSNCDTEAAMVEKIAMDISNKLNNSTPSRDFIGLVGMGAHIEKMKPLLCLESDEVRLIGIWGPSGIGKSTIARILFNEHSHRFQLCVFMENIKVRYPRPCYDEYSAQLNLQKEFLSQTFNYNVIEIPHLGVVQDRLKDKKILVILDDVDRLGQLDALAKETRWFGPGSRVIITTEDRKLLKGHGIDHIYKVEFPSTDEAVQIFCMNAFGQKSPKDGFEGLAWEVANLAGELPLGLKVMGSYFRGMSKHEWKSALPRLRTSLDGEFESILKFSYDALSDRDKELFLHIACFFNHKEMEKVEEHIAKKFLGVKQGLHVLADKSLISMDSTYMEMHNLLAQLGREIVYKQSIDEPGQRQFLIDSKEICEVLTDDATGSGSVLGIEFNFGEAEDELNISERAFEGMSNLQYLRIYSDHKNPDKMFLPQGLNYLSRKLRLLHWIHFPMTSLPSIINPEFLVELVMCHSKLEKLWEGIKPLRNLKWMDLSSSTNLKVLPDLSTATSLKELNCSFCSSLVELPWSIGNAINLEIVDLYDCSSLVELPSSISNSINIKKFNFRGCSNLVELPSSFGNATKLEELELGFCSKLVELPSSIRNATSLKELYLYNCSSLVKLPFSIGNFSHLKKFTISGCSSMVKLSSSIGNATDLKELDFSFCSSLVELPSSIGNATNLELLDLRGCSSLVKLPSSIGNAITNLDRLDFSGCSSLVAIHSSIGNAINLKYLEFSGCSSLVELPSSIGNLHNLSSLTLKGCSKLEVLPMNINLQSLESLIFTNCSLLKSFPEISTNISYLDLSGTAIEEVPLSITLWLHLETLHMPYSENLNLFPHALDIITDLHVSDTNIQELAPWVKKMSRLRRLVIKGCKKLLSLPQLPDSLSELDAENCESLERVDCSFLDPRIVLNFANCFKLNKEARDVIIQTSTCEVTVLTGGEMPSYFTYQANGDSLRVKLNERPFPSSLIFKACIILVNMNDVEDDDHDDENMVFLDCFIDDKVNNLKVTCSPSSYSLSPPLRHEHLYIFEFEVDVTSNELFFQFGISSVEWVIKECGVHNVNTKKRMRVTRTLSPFTVMDTTRTSVVVVVNGGCEVEEEKVNGEESAETKKGEKRMKFNDGFDFIAAVVHFYYAFIIKQTLLAKHKSPWSSQNLCTRICLDESKKIRRPFYVSLLIKNLLALDLRKLQEL